MARRGEDGGSGDWLHRDWVFVCLRQLDYLALLVLLDMKALLIFMLGQASVRAVYLLR